MDAFMPPELEAQITAHRERLAKLLPQQLRLLAEVLRRARRYGYCWAQQRTLAEAIGGAKSTVASDLRDFAALDLMRILKADVASRSGAYAEALGRSDVLVPAVGLDQALSDLRVAHRRASLDSFTSRETHVAGEARLGRPRTQRAGDARSSRSARPRAAGREPNATVRDRVRPAAVNDRKADAPLAANGDALHEFRPKPLQGPTSSPVTSSSRTQAEKQTTLRPRDAVRENDGDDDRVRLLVSEGFEPGCAASFARCFSRERIAANIVLGRHRRPGVQSPGAYLRGMIQRDDAAAAIDPRSEAAAAVRGATPMRRISTGKGAVVRATEPRAASSTASTRLTGAAATTTAADARPPIASARTCELDGLSADERERLTQRARDEVRRRHAFLGARVLDAWGPLLEAAATRTMRELVQSAAPIGAAR